jgi:hypothetical protein
MHSSCFYGIAQRCAVMALVTFGSVLLGAMSCVRLDQTLRSNPEVTSRRLEHPGGQKSPRPSRRGLALRAEIRRRYVVIAMVNQMLDPKSGAVTGDSWGDRGLLGVVARVSSGAVTGDSWGDRMPVGGGYYEASAKRLRHATVGDHHD